MLPKVAVVVAGSVANTGEADTSSRDCIVATMCRNAIDDVVSSSPRLLISGPSGEPFFSLATPAIAVRVTVP
jgi:hypothetical protein